MYPLSDFVSLYRLFIIPYVPQRNYVHKNSRGLYRPQDINIKAPMPDKFEDVKIYCYYSIIILQEFDACILVIRLFNAFQEFNNKYL